MRVRLTLDVTDENRRLIRYLVGKEGLATRKECRLAILCAFDGEMDEEWENAELMGFSWTVNTGGK